MNMHQLTVPETYGQNEDSKGHNALAGIAVPNHEAHNSRATKAAFLCQYGSPNMGGPYGREQSRPVLMPVLRTCTVPPTRFAAGERIQQPQHEDSAMANTATSTGEICPASTDPVIWVQEATVIKRVRRKLSDRGHTLRQSRTKGTFDVLDQDRKVLSAGSSLANLAEFLGCIEPSEQIEPNPFKDWGFCLARNIQREIDGSTVMLVAEPISIYFRTEKAARQAAAALTDGDDVFIVGKRVRRGGEHG